MADSNNRKAAPDDTETLISDAAVLSAGVGDRGANESDRMQRPQPSVFAGLGTQIHRHHKSRRRVRRMHSQEADLMDVAMTDDASIGSQSLVSFLSRTDCGLERLSEDDAVASIASVSTAATAAGLPALPPYPEVTARATRILSPPRPVTGRRPRGAALLAWRRGQSSSRSSAASSVAHGSERLRDSLHTVKMRSGELAGSDSEDGSHDGSAARRVELSDQSGSPLKDTYSFIYIYPLLSAPVLYAFLLCSFQALVFALLLAELIDVSDPRNPLRVPTAAVGLQMRVAQACAIVIAVLSSVDVMVAMNNLLRTPDAVVIMDATSPGGGASELHHGIVHSSTNGTVSAKAQAFPAGMKFKFANILRLIEGCLGLAASFILIVRSDDIIDMFINFAALEFVVNLDNLAFALAEHGLISARLQEAARTVDGLSFAYYGHYDHSTGNPHRQTNKKGHRGALCSDSAGRLAQLKGSYLSRLFGSPVRLMKSHPDTTRRTILFLITVVLFGAWGVILTRLNEDDILGKSINVQFFHAHVPTTTSGKEAEEGIKPFLAARSGTYVASFAQDDTLPFLERLSSIAAGRSSLFLVYHKVDSKVETPQRPAEAVPLQKLPLNYVEVVYFHPLARRWIFTACDPEVDLTSVEIISTACAGPSVQSIETDAQDLISLSSAAFQIVSDEHSDDDTVLPVSITSNECSPSDTTDTLRVANSNAARQKCSLSGGKCAAPDKVLGLGRQCLCPSGQYGIFCTEHVGTSCPTLEVLNMASDDTPGAAKFLEFEKHPFTLVKDERGVGNTPIWERRFKRNIDRIERRGGTHWTITRNLEQTDIYHTIAIAEASAPVAGAGTGPGYVSTNAGLSMKIQPPPAGLVFHEPKMGAWGTQLDYDRPFTSHKFHCKTASVSGQL